VSASYPEGTWVAKYENSSRIKAIKSRSIGWQPSHDAKDFTSTLADEIEHFKPASSATV
jgi:hypothetical protein